MQKTTLLRKPRDDAKNEYIWHANVNVLIGEIKD